VNTWGIVRILVLSVIILGFCAAFGKNSAVNNEDVLRIARSFKDGGKYNWSGSGTPEIIRFKGETILPVGKGTFCSGFTFTVAMRVAMERGLLNEKSIEQVRLFQREWYGATKKTSEIQAALAMKNLGIGGPVKFNSAQPGDFVQLWRKKKSGHSAIFLNWIEEKGKKVGFRYRSTQESTDGIGDKTEYFEDAPGNRGDVIRSRTYFARFKSA
jgi:hypothetical protein